MLEIHEDNLHEAYAIALAERSKGRDTVCYALHPRGPAALYVNLWDGCIGRVVGRQYWEKPEAKTDPTLNQPLTVQFLVVQCRITDVLEAARRAKKQFELDVAKPLQSNRIRINQNITTSR